jgi:hypothetical protein
LAIFETGSGFIPEKAWIVVFSFMIPTVAGVTGVHHYIQDLDGGLKHFVFSGWS